MRSLDELMSTGCRPLTSVGARYEVVFDQVYPYCMRSFPIYSSTCYSYSTRLDVAVMIGYCTTWRVSCSLYGEMLSSTLRFVRTMSMRALAEQRQELRARS